MSLASATALLKTALVLLALLQTNAGLPQSFHDHAIDVANQAISQATALLAPQAHGLGASSATQNLQLQFFTPSGALVNSNSGTLIQTPTTTVSSPLDTYVAPSPNPAANTSLVPKVPLAVVPPALRDDLQNAFTSKLSDAQSSCIHYTGSFTPNPTLDLPTTNCQLAIAKLNEQIATELQTVALAQIPSSQLGDVDAIRSKLFDAYIALLKSGQASGYDVSFETGRLLSPLSQLLITRAPPPCRHNRLI